jgi:hypothetical protein
MRRTIFAVIMAAVLLFSAGCGRVPSRPEEPSASGAVPAKETASPSPTEAPQPEPFDNRFLSAFADIAETEDAFYFHSCLSGSNYLYYYDKASGESGVLCGKPECEHDAYNDNRDCQGFCGQGCPSLSVYDGKLYFVGVGVGSAGEWMTLYRSELDGSNRELLRRLDGDEAGSVQHFFIYGGRLYGYAVLETVKDGEPLESAALLAYDMSGEGGPVKIVEYVSDSWSPWAYFGIANGSIYMLVTLEGLNGESVNSLYKVDPATDAYERIYFEENAPVLTGFWVTEDGTAYAGTQASEDSPGSVLKLTEGGHETLFAFESDEEANYYDAHLSDGIAVSLGKSKLTGERMLWVRGLDGGDIYKGVLPMAFAEGLEGSRLPGIGASAGNDKELIFFYQTNASAEEPGRSFLVKYGLSEGGISETVLCESRWG